MPYVNRTIDLSSVSQTVKGVLYDDREGISDCQRECIARYSGGIQLEQETYLLNHPEINAMLKTFLVKSIQQRKRKDYLKIAAKHFTRPVEELDKEIRELLQLPPDGPYITGNIASRTQNMEEFIPDVMKIISSHYPATSVLPKSSTESQSVTESSSFMSVITSKSTLATPEPSVAPSPTITDIFYEVISKLVDKVIALHINDALVLYDTAYVEVMNAVKEAMEMTVVDIKQDIASLLEASLQMFDMVIEEKAKIVAARNWEKRMRKKLKKSIRKADNFKGYECLSTPKSELSSHESYTRPLHHPCSCHQQITYNRYPKDRFGIYLPRKEEFSENNIITTPAISMENLAGQSYIES